MTAPDDADPADVEVWWGGYSGATMLPGWLVCSALAALLAYLTWEATRATGYGHPLALAVAAGIGLTQLLRWGARFFGRNYRLTNRRLILERGVVRLTVLSVDLTQLTAVEMRADWLEGRLGVGRVLVFAAGGRLGPLVLEGVRCPGQVAELLRRTIQAAKTTSPAGC